MGVKGRQKTSYWGGGLAEKVRIPSYGEGPKLLKKPSYDI